MEKQPVVWALVDDRPGTANQVLGVAEKLGWEFQSIPLPKPKPDFLLYFIGGIIFVLLIFLGGMNGPFGALILVLSLMLIWQGLGGIVACGRETAEHYFDTLEGWWWKRQRSRWQEFKGPWPDFVIAAGSRGAEAFAHIFEAMKQDWNAKYFPLVKNNRPLIPFAVRFPLLSLWLISHSIFLVVGVYILAGLVRHELPVFLNADLLFFDFMPIPILPMLLIGGWIFLLQWLGQFIIPQDNYTWDENLPKIHKRFGVQIMRAEEGYSNSCLTVIPQHDSLPRELKKWPKKCVLRPFLTPHRLTEQRLEQARQEWQKTFAAYPGPYLGMLVGGNSKHGKFTERDIERLMIEARELAGGNGLLITTSRRTGGKLEAVIKKHLLSQDYFHSPLMGGENPYLGILACADEILVTGDSFSMMSEAAFTRKPLHIFSPGTLSRKKKRFINRLENHPLTSQDYDSAQIVADAIKAVHKWRLENN